MNALEELSEKFIKVAEEFMPELEDRIFIWGQNLGEPEGGKPYVIITEGENELSHFTDKPAGSDALDEYARTFHITLHVYGRGLDTVSVAEKLVFLGDRTTNQNKFFANGMGVFCNRKIKPAHEPAGSTIIRRYDIEFALTFIGKSEPSRLDFEEGTLKDLTFEQ